MKKLCILFGFLVVFALFGCRGKGNEEHGYEEASEKSIGISDIIDFIRRWNDKDSWIDFVHYSQQSLSDFCDFLHDFLTFIKQEENTGNEIRLENTAVRSYGKGEEVWYMYKDSSGFVFRFSTTVFDVYDKMGNLIFEYGPDGGGNSIDLYKYDDTGNLVENSYFPSYRGEWYQYVFNEKGYLIHYDVDGGEGIDFEYNVDGECISDSSDGHIQEPNTCNYFRGREGPFSIYQEDNLQSSKSDKIKVGNKDFRKYRRGYKVWYEHKNKDGYDIHLCMMPGLREIEVYDADGNLVYNKLLDENNRWAIDPFAYVYKYDERKCVYVRDSYGKVSHPNAPIHYSKDGTPEPFYVKHESGEVEWYDKSGKRLFSKSEVLSDNHLNNYSLTYDGMGLIVENYGTGVKNLYDWNSSMIYNNDGRGDEYYSAYDFDYPINPDFLYGYKRGWVSSLNVSRMHLTFKDFLPFMVELYGGSKRWYAGGVPCYGRSEVDGHYGYGESPIGGNLSKIKTSDGKIYKVDEYDYDDVVDYSDLIPEYSLSYDDDAKVLSLLLEDDVISLAIEYDEQTGKFLPKEAARDCLLEGRPLKIEMLFSNDYGYDDLSIKFYYKSKLIGETSYWDGIFEKDAGENGSGLKLHGWYTPNPTLYQYWKNGNIAAIYAFSSKSGAVYTLFNPDGNIISWNNGSRYNIDLGCCAYINGKIAYYESVRGDGLDHFAIDFEYDNYERTGKMNLIRTYNISMDSFSVCEYDSETLRLASEYDSSLMLDVINEYGYWETKNE